MIFERAKILVMTDSPKIDTGFGRVGREVWSRLNATGKYDVTAIGWFHHDSNRESSYVVYPTRKNPSNGHPSQEDKYAHHSFPEIVEKINPDIVWTLGDMWMTDHVKDYKHRDSFKWVGYFPVDGEPVPSKWGSVVENMDKSVAYGSYGLNVMKQRAPKADLSYIYHGVDTKLFAPMSPERRSSEKKRLLGVDDKKVIGIIARNQPRKAFDSLFKMFYHVLRGEWYKCEDCGATTVSDYDIVTRTSSRPGKCGSCLSTSLTKGTPRKDVLLYLHCAPRDCGWDLIDLQEDYGLIGNIIFNPDLQVGKGVEENTLASIYNSIDIFTLPTRGEGFGLPVLEAMSCGIPIIATDYSAHPEWCGDGGILVPPKTVEAEPLTNIRRAIIDIDKYVEATVTLLDDEDLCKKYGKAGREQALKMDWSIVCKEWEKIIDSIAFPDGVPGHVEITDMKFKPEAV